MLDKSEVIAQYKELETSIDNRFFKRFCKYLNVDEVEQCGFQVKEEAKDDWEIECKWTEENIIKELVADAKFGLEKAENERGISSALMTEVCEAWLVVLEDDDFCSSDWGYNAPFFRDILEKYGG